jgi:hypothetical protein
MPCAQCQRLEDAKREADLEVLRSPLYSPEFRYWIIQSKQSRNLIEQHRRCCETCVGDVGWPIASGF